MNIRKCEQKDIAATGAFYDRVVEYLDSHINYPKWRYKEYPSEKYAAAMTAEGCQYIIEEDAKIIAAFVLNRDPEGDYDKGKWSRELKAGVLPQSIYMRAAALHTSVTRTCVRRWNTFRHSACMK